MKKLLRIRSTSDIHGTHYFTPKGTVKDYWYIDENLRTIKNIFNHQLITWGGVLTDNYEIIHQ